MAERIEKKPLNQSCGQFVFVLDKQEEILLLLNITDN